MGYTHYFAPPNPAKMTDSRATGYVDKFGDESWELDALEPTVIGDLITKEVMDVRVESKWKAAVKIEKEMKAQLQKVSDQWDDIIDRLE